NRAARSTRLMHMERAATRDARPVAAKRVLVGRDGFEPSTSGLKVRQIVPQDQLVSPFPAPQNALSHGAFSPEKTGHLAGLRSGNPPPTCPPAGVTPAAAPDAARPSRIARLLSGVTAAGGVAGRRRMPRPAGLHSRAMARLSVGECLWNDDATLAAEITLDLQNVRV